MILRVFLILFIAVSAEAQLYNIRNFSTEQGLPESKINTLNEDRRGNLWIGTSGAGLIRFDGYTFYSYYQEDGLINNYVRAVFEDQSGKLWIGTEAGLCTYNGYRFKQLPILASETVTTIAQDASQNIWIGTLNGLYRYDGKKLVPFSTRAKGLGKSINSIYFDKNSDLWIATTEGLGKYSGLGLTIFTKENGLPSNNIRSIMEDSNSDIWLATDAGISKKHGETFENFNTRNGLGSNDIYDLSQDEKKNLWIGTSSGIVKYDGRTFQHHEDRRRQTNNIITCTYKDSGGNLWFGSAEKGLGKLDSERFVHYPENDQLGKRVYSIIQAINGNIICGTSLGGTTVFDGKQYTLLNKREGFTSSVVQSFFYSGDSSLWVGTADDGFYQFSESNFHQYDSEEGFISRNVTGFAENAGKIWIATADSGVAVVQTFPDSLNVTKRFNTLNGLSSNRITSIASDKTSTIWIGTEDHGIHRIIVSLDSVKSDSITHITTKDGLNSNSIHAIITDSLGRVFIGTSQGVNIVEGNRMISLSKSNGLTSNNIYSLTIDANNNLWTGTERGVDMITYSPDFKSINIRHFESNEGFKGLEVYRNSSCVDKEGNVWFGTVNGLVKYNPREEIKSQVLPKVHITEIKLFFDRIQDTEYGDSVSAWYAIPSRLTLPYNQNNLSFSFVGVHHRNPQAVRYRWMLEGFDEEWSPPMDEREVTYSNIPPGDYTFKVMASNEFNIWSESPASFSFLVKPPIWEQWWARASGILLIVGFTALIFQVRVRRIKEKNRVEQERLEMEKSILELEQEAARLQMNPHFIFNSLNSIQGFISTNDPFQAKKYLAKFAKLMRLILENAREEFIPLRNEMNILENYMELERLSTNNTFDFSITTEESIDPDNIQIPPMMIQPFVENAIIHGIRKKEGKGIISINFSVKNDMIICTLQDNGIGRKRSGEINGTSRAHHKSTGISVTQKRLEQYGLHRKVEAGVRIVDLEEGGVPVGTRVIISTPYESY